MSYIPTWKPKQRYTGGLIGIGSAQNTGIYTVWEVTVYFSYNNEDVKGWDRNFEFRIRIPMKPGDSPKRLGRLVEMMAESKMNDLQIYIGGSNWKQSSTGYTTAGFTNSTKMAYKVIEKGHTYFTWPNKGWGILKTRESTQIEHLIRKKIVSAKENETKMRYYAERRKREEEKMRKEGIIK